MVQGLAGGMSPVSETANESPIRHERELILKYQPVFVEPHRDLLPPRPHHALVRTLAPRRGGLSFGPLLATPENSIERLAHGKLDRGLIGLLNCCPCDSRACESDNPVPSHPDLP